MQIYRRRVATIAILIILSLMLGVLQTTTTTRAQDGGLTDEQSALLDRVYTAVDNRDNYTSFALGVQETRTQNIDITVAGQSFTITQTATHDENRTTIRTGDQENIQSQVTLDFAEDGLDGQTAYVMEAEIRVVDGVLYLNAVYSESTPDLPTLSAGWQAFDQVESIPSLFDELKLEKYLEEDDTDPFDDRELIEGIITDINVEAGETADGEAVDVITFVIEGEGMRDFFAASTDEKEAAENPFTAVYASEGTMGQVSYTVALDAEDNALEVTIAWELTIDSFDVSTISDQFPPGTMLSLALSNERQESVSDINADLEPAVAPDIG